MSLPAQHELLDTFRAFLSEAGLSKVSVKNYVSDVRKFLEWTFTRNQVIPASPPVIPAKAGIYMEMDSRLRGNDSALPTPEAISKFVAALQDSQVPHSTINRYLASLRRYSVFLKVKYEIDVDVISTGAERSGEIALDSERDPSTSLRSARDDKFDGVTSLFLKSLQNEDLSHSTVKNYKSDLNHFLIWSANNAPLSVIPAKAGIHSDIDSRLRGNDNATDLSSILSPSSLDKYQDHLKIDQTSSSVINRRISTLKKFVKFALTNKLISVDPFQSAMFNVQSKISNPLAFFHRHSRPYPVIASGTKQSSIQNADGSPRRRYLLAMTNGVRNFTNKIKNNYAYRKYNALPFVPYLHLAILVLFVALLVNFGYDQIVTKAVRSQAYPASPTRPTRQLSFQGRLTDSSDTPITVATDVTFKLYNALTGGSQLYTSGTCSVTPDSDGIFNTLIGNTTCGAEIDNTVFSENQGVYMEVAVGATTLTPRQQIATVGYALNTETLQGYPISSTASATKSTVAVMNQYGEVILGEQSPVLKSVSGTFTLQGQTLSLSTASTTNGNINLAPDGTGSINAIGGATSGNFLRITDANLTSGNLISGYVGNNTATGNLLSLSSGSSETTRLAVGAFGQTTLDAAGKGKSALIVNQIDSGSIFAASASGTNRFLITNAGNITLNQATIIDSTGTLSLNTTNNQAITTGTGITTLGGNLVLNNSASTTTFGGLAYTWPSSQTSNYVLATNGSGTLSWNDASVLTGGTVYWNQANGSLFPKNSTVDAFIGGQATASAKFAFLNVNSGTPTASISGNSAGRALSIDGLGNITTTAMSPITIGSASTGTIQLSPKGTTGLFVNGSGNVGIGTTSPGTKLHIYDSTATSDLPSLKLDSTYIAGDSTGLPMNSIYFANSGTNVNAIQSVERTLNNYALDFQTYNGASLGTRMTILGNGNVGIGTTGPGAKLDVYSGGLRVNYNGDSTQQTIIRGVTNNLIFDLGSDAAFTVTGGDLVTERFRIQQSGNVGIGTVSPGTGARLDVKGGDILVTESTGVDVLRLKTTTSGAYVYSDYISGSEQPLYLGTYAKQQAVTVQATSGNVGIGTTGPGAKLEVAGTGLGSIFGSSNVGGTNSIRVINPATSGASNALIDINIGVGSTGDPYIVFSDNPVTAFNWAIGVDNSDSDSFKFSNSNVIGTNDRVTITTAGNVGIGTTAPSAKLHVVGNCVTGDTLLPIKRRKKRSRNKFGMTGGGDGDDDMDSLDDFDELLCPIRDIQPDDQVLSLNEATGTLEYSKINKLMDMGIKEVYELTTKSGRIIRTTAAHPFLTLMTA